MPAEGAIDTEGLDVSAERMAELLRVDPEELKLELPAIQRALREVRRPPSARARISSWRSSSSDSSRADPLGHFQPFSALRLTRPRAGRDSSASEVIVSTPREASSSTSLASSARARVELDQQVDRDLVLVVLVEAHVGEELACAAFAESAVGE